MHLRFLTLCLLVGTLAGAIGGAFHLAADRALTLHIAVSERYGAALGAYLRAALDRLGRTVLAGDTPVVPGLDAALLGHLAVAITLSVAMIGLAVLLVHRFAPEAGGSGIPEVEAAIAEKLPVRWARVLPVKFLGGVLSIGSGAVVGREGPTIHIGASVAAWLGDMSVLGGEERRGMIAAGGAAGLAAAFNAPVASVLFIMEETRNAFPYSFKTFTGVIVASIFSAMVTGQMIGTGPMLPIDVASPPAGFIVYALALGAVLGLCGLAFNRGLLAGLDLMQHRSAPVRLLLTILIGAALGTLLVFDSSTVGGGEGLIVRLVTQPDALGLLVALVLARFVLTIASYGLGVPGGLFAPILALAACLGLAGGALANLLIPGFAVPLEASAVIAMTGLFAATVRAPMVGVVLTAELTGGFDLLLPLLACAASAHLVAQGVGAHPIYEVLLERRLRNMRRPSA